MLTLDEWRRSYELTPAEMDVVFGTACGQTTREIAVERKTSEATVQKHAANAARKMGASGIKSAALRLHVQTVNTRVTTIFRAS